MELLSSNLIFAIDFHRQLCLFGFSLRKLFKGDIFLSANSLAFNEEFATDETSAV